MCRSKHTLSSKGHLLNKFDVPVEVRDLGGNFDTLGKKIFLGLWNAKIEISILPFQSP